MVTSTDTLNKVDFGEKTYIFKRFFDEIPFNQHVLKIGKVPSPFAIPIICFLWLC